MNSFISEDAESGWVGWREQQQKMTEKRRHKAKKKSLRKTSSPEFFLVHEHGRFFFVFWFACSLFRYFPKDILFHKSYVVEVVLYISDESIDDTRNNHHLNIFVLAHQALST